MSGGNGAVPKLIALQPQLLPEPPPVLPERRDAELFIALVRPVWVP